LLAEGVGGGYTGGMISSVIVLISLAPCFGKEVPRAPKPKSTKVSVSQLIEKTLKEGVAKPLSLAGDKKLGYSVAHNCKKLQYDDKASADGFHHRFQVVLDEKGKPIDVIIGRVRIVRESEDMVESYAYRMDTSGKLLAAIRGSGPPNKLVKDIMDISKPETIAAFRGELDFFTSKSSALPLAKIE
jgi:hypothetical protein